MFSLGCTRFALWAAEPSRGTCLVRQRTLCRAPKNTTEAVLFRNSPATNLSNSTCRKGKKVSNLQTRFLTSTKPHKESYYKILWLDKGHRTRLLHANMHEAFPRYRIHFTAQDRCIFGGKVCTSPAGFPGK